MKYRSDIHRMSPFFWNSERELGASHGREQQLEEIVRDTISPFISVIFLNFTHLVSSFSHD